MRLKLDFVRKVPKEAKDNEIILVKDKSYKNKTKFLNKFLITNKIFLEKKLLIQNIDKKTYIFVNCIKSKTSLDYEKLGSLLYTFLKNREFVFCIKLIFLNPCSIRKIFAWCKAKVL